MITAALVRLRVFAKGLFDMATVQNIQRARARAAAARHRNTKAYGFNTMCTQPSWTAAIVLRRECLEVGLFTLWFHWWRWSGIH